MVGGFGKGFAIRGSSGNAGTSGRLPPDAGPQVGDRNRGPRVAAGGISGPAHPPDVQRSHSIRGSRSPYRSPYPLKFIVPRCRPESLRTVKTAWRLVYTVPSERVDSYIKDSHFEFRDPLTPDDLAHAAGSSLAYMVRTRTVKARASGDSIYPSGANLSAPAARETCASPSPNQPSCSTGRNRRTHRAHPQVATASTGPKQNRGRKLRRRTLRK